LDVLRSRGLLRAAGDSRDSPGSDPRREGIPGWAEELIRQGVPTCELPRVGASDSLVSPVLGQYRILDQLGSGGMGQVFKAEHLLMKRVVALKVMAAHLVKDRSAVARFHREVQAMAQLAHPNIVTAHDAAEAHGLHFLVMEYVDGIDLGRLVAEVGPLPPPLACECIRQAAVGLQHAHERGLVHCDIKPANLLLTEVRKESSPSFSPESGLTLPVVKILDLGLARLAGTSPESPTLHSLPVPCSGPAGTPDFMAPEQAHNSPAADVRSDLYSLGCTLYYLLSGQVPFPGGSWSEKLLKHQFDEPTPLAELRPDVPVEIAAIVHRLMAKNPDERYPVPAALAEVLEVWLTDQSLHSERGGNRTPLPAGDTRPAVTGPTLATSDPEPATPSTPQPYPVPAPSSPGPEGQSPLRSSALLLTRKRRLPMPLAVGVAVVVGLGTAWLARQAYLTGADAPTRPTLTAVESEPLPGAFVLASRPNQVFDQLAAAVAAAGAGDRLLIRHDGTFSVRPIAVRGKSLTLEAAPGCRPRLALVASAVARVWQPLLSTDADLTLQGIDLVYDAGSEAVAEARPAHLVYSEGPTLRLRDCRLLAPSGCAPLVCRRPRLVELDACQVTAEASAVCVEAGPGAPPRIQVRNTALVVRQFGGAALSFWVNPVQPSGPVRLDLEGSQFRAGRVVALSGLTCGLEITAHDNLFAFREALLDFVAYPTPQGWKPSTRWQGRNNRYQSAGDWIALDGTPSGIRGLTGWKEVWGQSEPRSAEETPDSPASSVAAGPKE
jgi:serine/threonine protein kinase